ncbi:MAG TPA: hypothetical protein VFC79_00825 [Tissierellaceae bacterium]|nr:hypothetical protein [Tissierellaceae bacterium]
MLVEITINNVDIKDETGILPLNRHIVNAEIITDDEWADEWIEPIIGRQRHKYSYVSCDFLVEDQGDIEKKISKLLKLSSKAEVGFNDTKIKRKGYISSHEKKSIAKGACIIKIEWKCGLGYSDEEIIAVNDEDTIILPSTADTPVVISIIPDTNISELTIAGFGEDIILKNLTEGIEIIIDGEKGLVTEEGQNKFKDYQSWGFPKLVPGENKITISSDINITAIYSPRWL